ncbi:Eukaryotic translation initiation factor 3 subunit K [Rhizoctonia solani]|uniref:Eukaryotic translation initiation factor 3 subunit H n=1 Tax=Rhizoctonia solani TaxID=456999 RepID=A0A8H7LI02_9AGAM|nr:Eukaryotic translation initiation factor 3 subunit K [Rhizoctonia solani]KAF8760902.1 Eukaryotic translation initiation factor 3 subunit K [Rhizoctonia solani]
MATSMAAAIAATMPERQAAQTAAPATTVVHEAIPASMAKLMDVEAEIPLTSVELDGLVVMKIMKHSQESSNANGLLVGIDLDGTLNVTNSFAMPNLTDDDDKSGKAAANARYQVAMLRQLNEVQGDDSVVGFYQSCTLGGFLRQSLIEQQALHQEKLRHGGVVVVHDTSSAVRGVASLRAFRLSESFRKAHKNKKFDTASLISNQLTFSAIMEEFPVTVHNTSLLSAFLSNLSLPTQLTSLSPSTFPSAPIEPSFLQFDLNPNAHLERLVDAADAVKAEESNLAYHARQHARERTRAEAKRVEEDAQRANQGLPPMTDEEFARMFRLPSEPSRLESMLLLGQLDTQAKSAAVASSAEMVKMYLARPEAQKGLA